MNKEVGVFFVIIAPEERIMMLLEYPAKLNKRGKYVSVDCAIGHIQ